MSLRPQCRRLVRWGFACVMVCAGTAAGGAAAAQSNPEVARAWRDEAQRRYEARDVAGALQALQRALRADPQDAQLHFMAGNAHFRLSQFELAARAYRQSTALRPVHPDTWLGAGFAFFYAGQIDSAVTAWETSVLQSPPCVICRLGLALGYARKGESYFAALQKDMAMQLQPGCDERSELAKDVRWLPGAIDALRAIPAIEQVGTP